MCAWTDFNKNMIIQRFRLTSDLHPTGEVYLDFKRLSPGFPLKQLIIET